MKILALDSSTQPISIAISDDDNVITYRNLQLQKTFSNKIMPAIEALAKKAKCQIKDLDGIAVGLGPGSFTSLRVGLSTIKAMAMALAIPVVGIESHDVIAHGVKGDVASLTVVTDARRKLVYSATYVQSNGELIKQGNTMLVSPDELKKSIKDTVVVGDALNLYEDILVRNKSVTRADQKFWTPQAKILCQLAHARFKNKDYDDINSLVPLYLYEENCQVRN